MINLIKLFFFPYFSIALESENCDITPDDLNEYINNSNPEKDFFEQITDFGLGTSIIGRVSVQGVKSLGGHFAQLCRGLIFMKRKDILLFFKKKREILLHFS